MSELTETQIESSDDELPEEVAFDASKSAALKSVKGALEAAKREKNLLKEKRKKRQQLFQEQKKRKLLPQELLEELDKEPIKQTGPSNNEDINNEGSTKPSDDNNMDETETETTPNQISKSLPDSYRVTRIKDESAAKSSQQNAMDFLQSVSMDQEPKEQPMQSCCPSKRKGVQAKVQLWSLQIKNWVLPKKRGLQGPTRSNG